MTNIEFVKGGQVHAILTGGNQFSDLIMIKGRFNVSVVPLTEENEVPLPLFSGIVTLQRAFPDVTDKDGGADEIFIPAGEVAIWDTVAEYSTSTELADFQPVGALYRIGILTGNYTSGKVLVRIGG